MRRARESDNDELSDAEKRDLIKLINEGKPLPEKYRFILFKDQAEVELLWNGKTREVCTSILPFQTLEHIDEPRKEERDDEELGFDIRGRQLKGWTNKLIWGDNKLILSSLKSGALRRQIEDAGGLKLIYIDPPFDVGADFSMDIEIGGETFHKEPNLLEQISYRDTWGRGADSFIAMIYERLILMRDLLHEEGSIYVHCDWRVHAYIRMALDEVFGKERFLNDVIWVYKFGGRSSTTFARKHDTIFWSPRIPRHVSPRFEFTDNAEGLAHLSTHVKTKARWEKLLGEAEHLLPGYRAAIAGLAHESKGIRRSELFFFYALVAPLRPPRIVESGRARAQSTLVLAQLFPDTPVVSLESDAKSPDAAVAAERLRDFRNVDCRFGDSLLLLPEIVQSGDVVLIDGPKDFRALKLAFRLLGTRKPAAVFVHDLWLGSPARRFVDRHLPFALLSDEPHWVERYAAIDSSKQAAPAPPGARRAYGATMGCFEAGADDYSRRLAQCRAAQAGDRLRATARKLLRRPAPVRPIDFEVVFP